MRQRDDVVTWEYGHDENGNVVSAGFEVGETRFDIEHGSRGPIKQTDSEGQEGTQTLRSPFHE